MDILALTLAGVLLSGAPLLLAVLGETLTERAGVINLSLDGAMLLSAMVGFAAAYTSGNAWVGWLVAGLVGMAVAAVLALVGLVLERSQLAVGFILTLLCRDLAYFLGHSFSRLHGPSLDAVPHTAALRYTFPGNCLRPAQPGGLYQPAVDSGGLVLLLPDGSRAGHAGRGRIASRGVRPGRKRTPAAHLLYPGGRVCGRIGRGSFFAGRQTRLGTPAGMRGSGWIALAIVIFGGWNPIRAAVGAYFFAALQVAGIHLQDVWTGIPAPVFQVAPFPIMILTLLFVNMGQTERLKDMAYRHPHVKTVLDRLRVTSPAALGRDFNPEKDL